MLGLWPVSGVRRAGLASFVVVVLLLAGAWLAPLPALAGSGSKVAGPSFVQPGVFGCGGQPPGGDVSRPTAAQDRTFYAIADSAASFYAAETHFPVKTGWFLFRWGDTEGNSAVTCGLDKALARGTTLPAKWCEIDILPGLALTKGTIAHEVFHCVQLQILGSDAAFEAKVQSRTWVIEGGAQFAALSYLAHDHVTKDPTYDLGQSGCGYWVSHPATPLFPGGYNARGQGYNAIGFFALIQQAGGNPLAVMRNVIEAGSNEKAYNAAVSGHEKAVLDMWASTMVRENPPRGKAWAFTGSVCDPPAEYHAPYTAKANIVTVANGRSQDLKVAPYAAAVYELQPSADITVIPGAGKHVRVSGLGSNSAMIDDDDLTASYCTATNECACPGGTPAFTKVLGAPGPPLPVIAITGGPTGVTLTIQGQQFTCPPPNACNLLSASQVQQWFGAADVDDDPVECFPVIGTPEQGTWSVQVTAAQQQMGEGGGSMELDVDNTYPAGYLAKEGAVAWGQSVACPTTPQVVSGVGQAAYYCSPYNSNRTCSFTAFSAQQGTDEIDEQDSCIDPQPSEASEAPLMNVMLANLASG
ncbi:MAG: hypothetical protein ACLP01_32530 [Solirubrobacteraceae bacterium]